MKSILKVTLVTIFTLTSLNAFSQDLHTEVVGSGQPVILIPGLTCSADVYDETISEFNEGYEFHKITLPGFAGLSPLENPEDGFLDQVQSLIMDYIEEHNIEKPIIMGHSLGGFIALNMTVENPDLPSKLVIIDSLPFLPAIQMPYITNVEQAKPMAENVKSGMLEAVDQTVEERKATQMQFLGMMIMDEDKIETAAGWGALSDPTTTAQAMYELYTHDIRDQLDQIKVPTLVLGAWIAYQNYGVTRESNMANYSAQYKELENVIIDMTDVGNHFIMWDDPTFFYDWLNRFL